MAGNVPSESPFEINQMVVIRRSTCRQCEARRQRFRRGTNTQTDSMVELRLQTYGLTHKQIIPYTRKC